MPRKHPIAFLVSLVSMLSLVALLSVAHTPQAQAASEMLGGGNDTSRADDLPMPDADGKPASKLPDMVGAGDEDIWRDAAIKDKITPDKPFSLQGKIEHSNDPNPVKDTKTDQSNISVVRVRCITPHNTDPKDDFAIYPYPMLPPRMKLRPGLAMYDTKDMRDMLVSLGYTAVQSNSRNPYPMAGQWRIVYAYNEALAIYGRNPPHTIADEHKFATEMLPIFKRCLLKREQIEERRVARYKQVYKEFEETRADVEAQALAKGLVPVQVHLFRQLLPRGREGVVKVTPGNWWVAGVHKVAGLSYYWQVPVVALPGQEQDVLLSEDSALVIEGGW